MPHVHHLRPLQSCDDTPLQTSRHKLCTALNLALPISIVNPTTYGQKQPTHTPGAFIGTGPTIVGLTSSTWHPSPMQGIKRYNDADTTVTQPP